MRGEGKGQNVVDSEKSRAHLLAGFGIQQNPPQFDHLCRILGDVDAMFIASGCDVDDNVAIQLRGRC
jgi:hypothetical protein